MHILILTPHYNPDLGPSAPLFTMLSESLLQRGHQVTVITAVPHYPTGLVPPEYRGKWFRRSRENGVNVIRVGLPSVKRQALSQRLLQFLSFQAGAALAEIGQKFDAVIVANPALQVWLPFTWANIIRRKPTIFSVHDVYPDVGIKLGIFKTRTQIAIVSWMERFCLDHASFVRILSDSFRPGIGNLKIPSSKIVLVYDWVDTNLIHPMNNENKFSHQYGLPGKFVVMYAGNIGLSQGLEHLLTTAGLLSEHKDIQFAFVGDGAGLQTLQNQAQQAQLMNVQFIPFQPRERLPEVLASADISMVILKKGIGTASLPSKILSIMASGRPILISVEAESESWRLIERAEAGIWVPPEDPMQLADAILMLRQKSDLRERLGHNGRCWAEQHHSAQYAAEQFERLLLQAVEQRKVQS
jgi:colanic acid biosynthesis glycosyl transferase WcaI